MEGNLEMWCSVKASQNSFRTFIWSQDISARVSKGNVIVFHFDKRAWQIYIKGKMSKRQSDGIIETGIKTWPPGRQRAMITWSASKVTREECGGWGAYKNKDASILGGYKQRWLLHRETYVCLLENKQRSHAAFRWKNQSSSFLSQLLRIERSSRGLLTNELS